MDLHGRSLLKEIDFTKEEFLYLVDLAEQLRNEKRAGTERQRHGRAQHRPHLREGLDPDPVAPSRSAPTTRGPTSPTSGPEGSQIGHKRVDQGHRPGARADVRRHRVPGLRPGDRRDPGRFAGVPVWNGLTDQWHPTQMLADILTMRDHADKPLERGRLLLPGRRPQQHRQLPAGHRRPARAWTSGSPPRGAAGPPPRSRASPSELAADSGARLTHRRRCSRGGRGSRLRLHRRLGVHGRAGRRSGTSASTSSCRTRSTRHSWRRPATRTSSSCTASRRCTTPTPSSVARSSTSRASTPWR